MVLFYTGSLWTPVGFPFYSYYKIIIIVLPFLWRNNPSLLRKATRTIFFLLGVWMGKRTLIENSWLRYLLVRPCWWQESSRSPPQFYWSGGFWRCSCTKPRGAGGSPPLGTPAVCWSPTQSFSSPDLSSPATSCRDFLQVTSLKLPINASAGNIFCKFFGGCSIFKIFWLYDCFEPDK